VITAFVDSGGFFGNAKGGSGGKRGHSNMEHGLPQPALADLASKRRPCLSGTETQRMRAGHDRGMLPVVPSPLMHP
jgi:hypothetical protein